MKIHGKRSFTQPEFGIQGKVISITELRPQTLIKDDAITTILRTVKQPTFVTNNVFDFWRKIPARLDYCVVCFVLPNERMHEMSPKLRSIFRIKEFKTKAARMGKVIRVRHQHLDFYQVNDNAVHAIPFLIP